MSKTLSTFANPAAFMKLSSVLLPIFAGLTFVTLVIGSVWALLISPEHAEQGYSVRVMYVHVPAAWMSMFTYIFMAIASVIGFIWRHNLAHMGARYAALLGTAFTVLTIITGAVWGKVTWGVFWDWDPRMVGVLIMLFIYLGYMALWQAIEDEHLAANAAALLCIFGVVMIPIIRYAVDSAGALHQSSSVIRADGPSIPAAMMFPLMFMAVGYQCLFGVYMMMRLRSAVMEKQIAARQKSPVPRAKTNLVIEEGAA